MPSEVKRSTSPSEQIDILRQRGMEVDQALAEQWLANVGYYRLSAYWHPARVVLQGQRQDAFEEGTRFADVVALYEADRKLRTLIHDGMERIEVMMRTRVTELLCEGGPLNYTDSARFRSGFGHQSWMDTAHKRLRRAGRHNAAVCHYFHRYGGDFPLWVLAEVLDFSDVSRLFEGLRADDQQRIAKSLGIDPVFSSLTRNQRVKAAELSPLARWMEQLTIVRNTCAHHGRLWNKSFVPAPTPALRTQPEFHVLPEGQSERVFGALVLMSHLLRVASPGTSWPQKVSLHVQEGFLVHPIVDPSSLGVPSGWNGSL